MRKALLLILPLLIILPQKIYGESITTGNASAKSEVRTEVQGDANVYTKIEVEANGEKKTLESNEPGTHSLEVKSDANSNTEASSSVSTEESSDEAELKETKSAAGNIVQKIFQTISELFKKVLSIFGAYIPSKQGRGQLTINRFAA